MSFHSAFTLRSLLQEAKAVKSSRINGMNRRRRMLEEIWYLAKVDKIIVILL
jgi:hypothetical protein